MFARENKLVFEYTFTNTGTREITFLEYCHNFITLNGVPAGPDCWFRFPTLRSFSGRSGETGCLVGTEDGFTLSGEATGESRLKLTGEDLHTKIPFRWEVCHSNSGLSVSGVDSFAPSEIVLWVRGANLSPEIKKMTHLSPGETEIYSRTLVFRAETL